MSNRIQIFNLRAQLFDLSFCVGGVFFVATKPAQLERIVYESVKSHTVCGDCAFVVVDLTLFSSVLTVYANEGPLLAVDLEVVKMLRLLKLIQPFLCHCRIRFRSEERRVGKEGGSRWSTSTQKEGRTNS